MAWLKNCLEPCCGKLPAALRGALPGAAAAAASLLLLAAIASAVMSEAPGAADLLVSRRMRDLRSPPLDALALAITRTGNPVALLAVAATTGILLLLARRRHELAAMAACYAGTGASVAALKWLLPRARPEAALQTMLAQHAAFPSAHAASSLVVYGFAAYLVLRHGRTPYARRLLPPACLALVLLIGLSRLYLDVHWLSDVLGGYALGGFWLALLVTVAERRRAPAGDIPRSGPAARAERLLIPALLLFLLLYAAGGRAE